MPQSQHRASAPTLARIEAGASLSTRFISEIQSSTQPESIFVRGAPPRDATMVFRAPMSFFDGCASRMKSPTSCWMVMGRSGVRSSVGTIPRSSRGVEPGRVPVSLLLIIEAQVQRLLQHAGPLEDVFPTSCPVFSCLPWPSWSVGCGGDSTPFTELARAASGVLWVAVASFGVPRRWQNG